MRDGRDSETKTVFYCCVRQMVSCPPTLDEYVRLFLVLA